METIDLPRCPDFEWAVQLNRFSLRLFGLWPEVTASSHEKLCADLRLFGIFTGITIICTIPSLHSLVRVWGDITAMIDNLLFSLPLVTLSMKMLILWWKRETLSSLIIMIAHDWIKTKSSDERDIMIRCAQIARLIITGSYLIIWLALTIVITTSGFGFTLRYVTNVTITTRPLPMQAHYVYDTTASPQFELTFLFQCIALTLVTLGYTGIDNFIGLLIFHICGQLENLTNRLYRMREAGDFITALRINVKEHIRLIRLVGIIENTFTVMLLLMFLIFGALFCIYGFVFITVIFEEQDVPMKRILFVILTICASFVHMCIYCAVGELLVIKYEKLYNTLYECEWYTLETKQAKNLIFLMIRMNKPLYITAGKMFPMTMSTFCSILKTSGSYISVLLANRN